VPTVPRHDEPAQAAAGHPHKAAATGALNKTCRYCPRCDLPIAHQDELEAWLAAFFRDHQPEIVGNDYMVLGTEDRADWLR
jgi:hypothetical protein